MAGLDLLVKRAVRMAFQKAGTLTKQVSFTSSDVTGFNFSTATTDSGPTSQKIISMVLKSLKVKIVEGASVKTHEATLFVPAEDAPDLNSYDKLEMDGLEYSVVHPIVNDGYLLTVIATRSGNG